MDGIFFKARDPKSRRAGWAKCYKDIENGKFGYILDPDATLVELWEPNPKDPTTAPPQKPNLSEALMPTLKSRGVTLLKSVAGITLGVVIGATLFLVIFEKHFIYYPAAAVDLTPNALGLPFDEMLIDVEPGVKIHGWFIKAATQPSVATVLFSHGNAGNIADRIDRVQSLRSLGADFLLYDYRGYGKSTGDTDEEGTYRDGRAAYDYLVKDRQIDPGHIVLMGESLGCAVSIQLALERKAAGLVIEAPFASIAHMANAVYPFLPLGSFIRTRYENVKKIPQLKMPLLVIQGTQDEVIPVDQGRMVFAAAPEPKQYVAIEGAHHNDVYIAGGEGYRRVLSEFIARVRTPLPPAARVEKVK